MKHIAYTYIYIYIFIFILCYFGYDEDEVERYREGKRRKESAIKKDNNANKTLVWLATIQDDRAKSADKLHVRSIFIGADEYYCTQCMCTRKRSFAPKSLEISSTFIWINQSLVNKKCI